MNTRILSALLICSFLFFAPNFSDAADFGSALSITTANVPPGADVAGMGNCWVAMPNFSANNPAIVAASDSPFRFGASYSYGLIVFKRGPNLNVHISSASVTLLRGVLQVNFSSANSGSAGTAMDVDAKFAYAPTIELMYGLRAFENLLRDGDKLYLGVGGSLSTAKMNFSLSGQNMLVSRSRGFLTKTGFLYQPVKGLNFGGMYAYSRDRNDDREFGINDDGSQSWSAKRSTSDMHQVRLGASWQVMPRLLLAADYQHLNIGHVKRDQYFVGAEVQVVKEIVSLYAGCANGGPTAGIGVYPSKNFGLNVAYGRNLFRDLDPHLGRSQMLSAMAFFNF